MASTTIQNALHTALKELQAEKDRIAAAIADLEKTVRGFLKGSVRKVRGKAAGKKKTKKRKVGKKTGREPAKRKVTKKKTKRKKPVWTEAMRRKARLRAKKQHAAARKKG